MLFGPISASLDDSGWLASGTRSSDGGCNSDALCNAITKFSSPSAELRSRSVARASLSRITAERRIEGVW